MGYLGLTPGLIRSPGEGNSYALQYSGLENFMDSIVHVVAKSWRRLSDFHLTSSLYHNSIFATANARMTMCYLKNSLVSPWDDRSVAQSLSRLGMNQSTSCNKGALCLHTWMCEGRHQEFLNKLLFSQL